MKSRKQADKSFSPAQARGTFVVTPDNATSPMDAESTHQIAKTVIDQLDHDYGSDQTTELSTALIDANDPRRQDSHRVPSQSTPDSPHVVSGQIPTPSEPADVENTPSTESADSASTSNS